MRRTQSARRGERKEGLQKKMSTVMTLSLNNQQPEEKLQRQTGSKSRNEERDWADIGTETKQIGLTQIGRNRE